MIATRQTTVSGLVGHGKGLRMLKGVGADEHHWQELTWDKRKGHLERDSHMLFCKRGWCGSSLRVCW